MSAMTLIAASQDAALFPATIRESRKYWRSRNAAVFEQAERSLLSSGLDFSSSSTGSGLPKARQFHVPLPGYEGAEMNTLEVLPTTPTAGQSSKTAIVLLHGYGAAMGFYFQNLPALAPYTNRFRVLATDWLGMGRSTRMKVRFTSRPSKPYERICEAENFFVDSLDAWRHALGLEKLILVAHSLGAYFASAYALRHPERVLKLILISPAGFVSRKANCQTSSSMLRCKEDTGFIYSLLHLLWKWEITPLHLVRCIGFFAPLAVAQYLKDRLIKYCPPHLHRPMFDYCFSLTFAKPGSENALFALAKAGAEPVLPMAPRLRNVSCSLVVIYGQDDWVTRMNQKTVAAFAKRVKFEEIEGAGHLPFYEQPTLFNKTLYRHLPPDQDIEEKLSQYDCDT